MYSQLRKEEREKKKKKREKKKKKIHRNLAILLQWLAFFILH